MKRILRITILLLLFTFLPFKIIGIAKEKDKVNFEEVMDFTAEDGDDKQQLIIPTQEELKACGYPENEYGETYGPDICYTVEPCDLPDLVLVQNNEGILGYVRSSELNDEVKSVENALEKNVNVKTVFSMYLQDGKTYVGEFTVEK